MSRKNKKGVFNSLFSITISVVLVLLILALGIFYFTDTVFPFKLPFDEKINEILDVLGINSNAEKDDSDLNSEITPQGGMDIHVLDVGQGSATLIISNDRAILIDAGENGSGQKIVQKLNELGFYHLDMIIGTHPHSDHIGGIDEVMSEIQVNNIILPELPKSIIPTTKTYLDLLKTIESQEKTVFSATPGDSYEIGNLYIEILGPILGADSNLNNFSVISRITAGGKSVLVTGDAEKTAEDLLLTAKRKLSSDILIVGHHGSASSSTKKFLEAVSPSYGAISVGYNNSYGHPSEEIINRLNNINCSIYRTDQHGNIVFKVSNNNILVESDH